MCVARIQWKHTRQHEKRGPGYSIHRQCFRYHPGQPRVKHQQVKYRIVPQITAITTRTIIIIIQLPNHYIMS